MSRLAFIAVLAVPFGLTGGYAAVQSDVLAALGTNLREAQDSIFSTMATGIVTISGAKSVFRSASPDQRASMARAIVAIARAFTGSPEFARRYTLYRDTQRPGAPTAARTGDEARTQQQEVMEQAIKQALASAQALPADARKQLEENIAEMRNQIAELNADPEYRAGVDASAAEAARLDAEEHAQKLAAFEAEYPADVNTLIARRLRQFLVACDDVNYAAALETGKDKIQRFVNPAYERRSAEWKMCFRAGQPAVDAARAAANEWLQAIDEKRWF